MTAVSTFDIGGDAGAPFVQGAGYTVTFTAAALGDVTGWSAHLQVRTERYPAGALLVDLSQADGITVDGPASKLVCTFTAARTALVRAGRQFYDLFIAAPGAQPMRLIAGRVVCQQQVTFPAVEP